MYYILVLAWGKKHQNAFIWHQTGLICLYAGRTSLAEEGEFFVAVFRVPAVQAPLVHALDLKALQLGAKHVILRRVRLAEVSQTLRRQKHLHGPCEEQTHRFNSIQMCLYSDFHNTYRFKAVHITNPS